jgi:hypothetical protein
MYLLLASAVMAVFVLGAAHAEEKGHSSTANSSPAADCAALNDKVNHFITLTPEERVAFANCYTPAGDGIMLAPSVVTPVIEQWHPEKSESTFKQS